MSQRIFIVHGHDDYARETVARFLEKIGFEAVILHEQANMGRTIIEKVEAESDVGFAVVLLTPDDEGAVKGGTPEPRARQNVILELGYFTGGWVAPACARLSGVRSTSPAISQAWYGRKWITAMAGGPHSPRSLPRPAMTSTGTK